MKKLKLAIVTTLIPLAACTPAQVQAFLEATPEQQYAIKAALSARPPADDCVGAMHAVWPEHLWSWGMKVMRAESGYSATARNSSGATGCWQTMIPMHQGRYNAIGCPDPRDAYCNNLVAYEMYKVSGTNPWAATR